jgi:hypothetical protein
LRRLASLIESVNDITTHFNLDPVEIGLTNIVPRSKILVNRSIGSFENHASLIGRLVMAGVAARMAGTTIRQELKQHRPLSTAAFPRSPVGCFENRKDIVPIHRFAAETVSRSTIRDLDILHHFVDSCRGSVKVVLAHEKHRKVPNRSHVQSCGKRLQRLHLAPKKPATT